MDVHKFQALKFLIVILFVKWSFGNRYNISLTELAACKEYRIESGYMYRNFFGLENIENNFNEGEKLRLKFYVMAQSNAHILLSPMDNAKKSDRVYEIVIGAGKNTFSTIRPNIGGSQLIVKKQNGLLNGIDPTPIIVAQKLDGTIEVTIPTFVGPLLSYKDSTPLLIKYVSFSSYGTTSARWFYDCKGDRAAHLEMEERNLTSLEKLQQNLFVNYSIFTIPEGLTKISMGGTIKRVFYNPKESIFQIRLELKMKWYDRKLQWNPIKYGNITAIRSFEINFWTPLLRIMNGAASSFTGFDPEIFGIIYNNGSVEAYTKQQKIETWCQEPDDQNWPWDELKCSVDVAIEGDQLSIDFDSNTGIHATRMTESAEWRFVGVDFTTRNSSGYNKKLEGSNVTHPGVNFVVHMRRNILFYRKVFFTPLIVASILILLSFQMKRFLRAVLNLSALVLLLGVFATLATHTPSTYVPKIVHIYEAYLGITCFSYFLSIFNRWLEDFPPEEPPPAFISTIVNSSVIRNILRMQFADASEYLSIQHEPWKQIGLILDRIICTIFVIVFIVMPILGFK